tara:strand:+ start:13892 stop:15364 length:1473 start_codon:yes stop_codon:yes gene_type:complete
MLTQLSLAIDNFIVEIKQVSSSGRTLYLESGYSNNIGNEDYGILVKKVSYNKNNKEFIYKPVAKLKAIKVFLDDSLWVAYKVFLPEELKEKNRLFLFSETAMLSGRRMKFTSARTKLVTNNDAAAETKDFLLEGDSLARKKKNYQVIEKTHKAEKHFENDLDFIDIERWEQKLDGDRLYADGIYRSPYAEEFSERHKVHTFEKMVVAFLRKYNDPNFDFDEFYAEQKRTGNVDEMQDRLMYKNVAKKYDERVLNRTAKEEKFLENVRSKGDAWSSDYSDEELSELLNNLSVVKERRRRALLKGYKYNYQLFASVGRNLVNNENTNDFETTEQNKYDFEIAAEGYFFKKFTQLQRVTMEASVRRAKDGFYTGEVNASSLSLSGALHLNWYPFELPHMQEVNILYVGTFFRYGLSRLKINPSDEEGNYQIYSFPGIRGGLKYNFSNSYGLRITAAYEEIRAERVVRNFDDGFLPDRARYIDAKLAIGLSKFF